MTSNLREYTVYFIYVDSFHATLTDNLGISKPMNAIFNWLIIGYTCFAVEREDESSPSVSVCHGGFH